MFISECNVLKFLATYKSKCVTENHRICLSIFHDQSCDFLSMFSSKLHCFETNKVSNTLLSLVLQKEY